MIATWTFVYQGLHLWRTLIKYTSLCEIDMSCDKVIDSGHNIKDQFQNISKYAPHLKGISVVGISKMNKKNNMFEYVGHVM